MQYIYLRKVKKINDFRLFFGCEKGFWERFRSKKADKSGGLA
jgi:hypothetical protein